MIVLIHIKDVTYTYIADIPDNPEVKDLLAISLIGIVSPSFNLIRDLPIIIVSFLFNIFIFFSLLKKGVWGLGFGVWGLGAGIYFCLVQFHWFVT